MDEESCALLLLAAGGSQRMGRPKQLLPFDGEPLIRTIARRALGAQLGPNVLVLGAHAGEIRPQLEDLPFAIIENPDWSQGIASSLRLGVLHIGAALPAARGLIVMLADQPQVTTAHLEAVVAAQRATGRSIVATDYGDHLGPPAYFGREHFRALQALHGDVGARALLQAFNAFAVAAPAEAGDDLDTPADYARLIESRPVNR